MEFRGNQSTYVASLPPVDETPLFQQYDSLYRALAKATATNPDDRFQSADELRDQLLGVLREVVAVDSGTAAAAHSTASSLFGSPTGTGAQLRWADLPALRVDRADAMATWLAGVSLADGAQRLEALEQAPESTVEVRLAQARATIDASSFLLAADLFDRSSPTTPGSGGRCGCRDSPRWRSPTTTRPRRRSTRHWARCQGSWRCPCRTSFSCVCTTFLSRLVASSSPVAAASCAARPSLFVAVSSSPAALAASPSWIADASSVCPV